MTAANPLSKIIVALSPLAGFDELLEEASFFQEREVEWVKVGIPLIFEHGRSLCERLRDAGLKVLLDMKHPDTPDTHKDFAELIMKKGGAGVSAITTTPSVGRDSISGLRDNLPESIEVWVVPLLSNVSGCCSHYKEAPWENIFDANLGQGWLGGATGVIATPHFIKRLGADYEKDGKPFLSLDGKPMKKIAVGVRPVWAPRDNHQTPTSPSRAIIDGADFVIMGRPLTNPPEYVKGGKEEALALVKKEILLSQNPSA